MRILIKYRILFLFSFHLLNKNKIIIILILLFRKYIQNDTLYVLFSIKKLDLLNLIFYQTIVYYYNLILYFNLYDI